MLLVAAVAVIVLAVLAIARGVDVRLALLASAFALAGLAGDASIVLRTFLTTFSDEKFVVPICSAMGFAYVLKQTGCDQHLVQLLVKPLRRGKLLLIPGVVLVGFVVNIPVISQTSTAVCLGAVVVPLMRAAGIAPVTIGASILLGASIGGELLNPGAPELNTVAQRLGIDSRRVVDHVIPLILPHLALVVVLFWLLSIRGERRTTAAMPTEAPPEFRVNLVRALVPFVPLVLLFITSPPLSLVEVPERWLVAEKPWLGLEAIGGGSVLSRQKADPAFASRLIGAAMLVGVLAAALANPSQFKGVMGSFFEGAGYAFAQVVSLIVTAHCFGKAIEQIGVAQLMGEAITQAPGLLLPMAGGVPLGFAALSGSGMAATQSLYGSFVSPAQTLGVDPIDIGALVSVAAAAGRTMSPVAAVALMSAQLTGTNPFALARRVAVPLLISLVVIVVLRMVGLI
jgi:C4-dicarboxylate transporter, DcuC family